jgi:hypothetical protein
VRQVDACSIEAGFQRCLHNLISFSINQHCRLSVNRARNETGAYLPILRIAIIDAAGNNAHGVVMPILACSPQGLD